MPKVVSSWVFLFNRIVPHAVCNGGHGDVNYYRTNYRVLPGRKFKAEPASSHWSLS